jgi:hypothetical protein
MRRTTTAAQAIQISHFPRGWIVLGAAIASWMLVAAMWMATSQLFVYVSGAI